MRKVGGLREEKKKMLRCLLSVKAFKVNAPIRSINIFDSLLKGSMTDQQRKMMENLTKDPAAMKDTLNKLQDVMKVGCTSFEQFIFHAELRLSLHLRVMVVVSWLLCCEIS